MASAKGGLDSIKAGIRGLASRAKIGKLASRLSFLKRSTPASPEPFSTIEDDTPLGDLLSSRNAAPVGPKSKGERERPDVRGILELALKRKPFIIGLLSTLAVAFIVAVVAVAVTIPPTAPKAAPAFTKEGLALVKQWLPPPGDPLEPRIEMERSGIPTYTSADAAKLGRPADPRAAASLAEKNDEAIEDLYGTVP
jgi:hypothetical protein